jgi:hypothetical protein
MAFWLLCYATTGFAAGQKMKSDELVRLHLAALGAPASIEVVLLRNANGHGSIEFLSAEHMLPSGTKAQGPLKLQDTGSRLDLSMNLDNPEYPADGFSFDGKKVLIVNFNPSSTSGFDRVTFPELGYFLGLHEGIVEKNIFGGVLRTSWALLSLNPKKDKLKYRGLKKDGSRKFHALEYKIPNIPDGSVTATLYFDPETYRHVLTRYKIVDTTQRTETRTVAVRGGVTTRNVSVPRNKNHELLERFSDFQEVDGLDLPHTWSIELRREIYPLEVKPNSHLSQRLARWDLSLTSITHNQLVAR